MARSDLKSKSMVSVTYVPQSDTDSSHYRPPGFMVFADADLLDKWREDHRSVALANVLERMQVYVTRGATRTGIKEAPSKQVLAEAFETTDIDEIIEHILEVGHVQAIADIRVNLVMPTT